MTEWDDEVMEEGLKGNQLEEETGEGFEEGGFGEEDEKGKEEAAGTWRGGACHFKLEEEDANPDEAAETGDDNKRRLMDLQHQATSEIMACLLSLMRAFDEADIPKEQGADLIAESEAQSAEIANHIKMEESENLSKARTEQLMVLLRLWKDSQIKDIHKLEENLRTASGSTWPRSEQHMSTSEEGVNASGLRTTSSSKRGCSSAAPDSSASCLRAEGKLANPTHITTKERHTHNKYDHGRLQS